jgi:hypothetical protein
VHTILEFVLFYNCTDSIFVCFSDHANFLVAFVLSILSPNDEEMVILSLSSFAHKAFFLSRTTDFPFEKLSHMEETKVPDEIRTHSS